MQPAQELGPQIPLAKQGLCSCLRSLVLGVGPAHSLAAPLLGTRHLPLCLPSPWAHPILRRPGPHSLQDSLLPQRHHQSSDWSLRSQGAGVSS